MGNFIEMRVSIESCGKMPQIVCIFSLYIYTYIYVCVCVCFDLILGYNDYIHFKLHSIAL